MARRRRAPKRVTKAQKAKILRTAKTQGLTAGQVERRFGISKWTYYGWRKRTSTTRTGTGRMARATAQGMSARALRAELKAMLPNMVQDEVTKTLAKLVSRSRRKSR